jgi:ubiquinone/menaquinone biosynthesis C-methylase UbiE
MTEIYTPGYTRTVLDIYSRRTLQSHGAFFIPYLRPGMAVLDCGCGPGSITLGIAERVGHGTVIGVDINESQVELSRKSAVERGIINVSFRPASAYELPFPEASFDAVFSNALFEHLREPNRALQEFRRVLRQGGTLGISSPDWGGFLYSPPWEKLTAAIRLYTEIQNHNGGDTGVGRKLVELLIDTGFVAVKAWARYENYENLHPISEVIASELDTKGETVLAAATREWAALPYGMFAMAWVSCVGGRPD